MQCNDEDQACPPASFASDLESIHNLFSSCYFAIPNPELMILTQLYKDRLRPDLPEMSLRRPVCAIGTSGAPEHVLNLIQAAPMFYQSVTQMQKVLGVLLNTKNPDPKEVRTLLEGLHKAMEDCLIAARIGAYNYSRIDK